MKTTTRQHRPAIRGIYGYSFFILLFHIVPFFSNAQCIASGTRNAGTVVNNNTIGVVAFANPGNATISNDSRAVASATVAILSGNTNYLVATGFGFTIPSYASICGVVVEVEKSAGGIGVLAWIQDNQVRLVKGGTITGSNLADLGNNWAGGDVIQSYGNSSGMWGTTLIPADVNNGNFGVAVSCSFEGVAILLPSARVDNIRMTIYYNLVLPTRFISFSAILKNNTAHLEWKTGDEEDAELITLQRSVTGQSIWNDIAIFEMHQGSGNSYTYDDRLLEKAYYTYRLRVTNASGYKLYSVSRNIHYTGNAVLSLYPNPTSDFIVIDHIKTPGELFITNMDMKRLKVQPQLLQNGSVRVDIRGLSKGIYCVRIGDQYIKFMKE
jgi:hypothetical protein